MKEKRNGKEEISLEQLRYVHYNGYSSPDILETYKVKIYDEKCSLFTDAVIEMTDELWEFLGMVSEIEVDETVSSHAITLKFGEKSLPIVAKALESFGITLDNNNNGGIIKLTRSSVGYTCEVRSSSLWQFCYTAMCVSKRDLCHKAVPHIVFQQNFGAIRSYLNGLKSTSDIRYKTKDNDENRTWTYTTRSETMAHDVMQLWSKLGYHSAICSNDNERGNKTYKVRTKLAVGNNDDKNTDLHFSKIPMTLFDFTKFRNVINKKKKKKISSARNRELGRIRKHIERHGYVTEEMARKIVSECLAVIDTTDSLEFVRNFDAVENTEVVDTTHRKINKAENITRFMTSPLGSELLIGKIYRLS